MRLPTLGLGLASLASLLATGECIWLMSWNVRYDWDRRIPVASTIASLPSRLQQPSSYYANPSTERPWHLRRQGVAASLQFHAPAIASFQEASDAYMRDMKTLSGVIGAGLDSGEMVDE